MNQCFGFLWVTEEPPDFPLNSRLTSVTTCSAPPPDRMLTSCSASAVLVLPALHLFFRHIPPSALVLASVPQHLLTGCDNAALKMPQSLSSHSLLRGSGVTPSHNLSPYPEAPSIPASPTFLTCHHLVRKSNLFHFRNKPGSGFLFFQPHHDCVLSVLVVCPLGDSGSLSLVLPPRDLLRSSPFSVMCCDGISEITLMVLPFPSMEFYHTPS